MAIHISQVWTSLAELLALTTDLNKKNVAALDRGRAACALKQVAIDAFNPIISRIAAHVNSVAAGDTTKLITSGFPMARRAEPYNSLAAPSTKGYHYTGHENKVLFRWERVPGALVYVVEGNATPDVGREAWQRVAITSRPKAVVDRTADGRIIAYRVRAIGSKLQGPASQVTMPKAA
ncbi:MAG: hypothetical protein IPL52_11190 [Flavobacteriales bacterium]|nr:hypothetical protein [Flavobacteriales bacterium]